MEYQYPKFTKEMKKTHTILIPNMAVTQFRLLKYALEHEGYKCEILGNCGSAVAQLGLKYVHNDTCYPALLVIGQFIDALNSGKYDLDRTALLITQTGGGCRASNYIHLLRKALVKADYPQIPVASLNFSGLEKDSGFQMDLPLLRQAVACIFYGDMLCALRNQIAPYEDHPGDADRLVDVWIGRIGRALLAGKGYTAREMKHTFPLIAREFAVIPRTKTPKVKVGVVGEIYVKYSPLGNNDLQKFLEGEGCEVNFPGLMGFVQYCIFNMGEDHVLYGGSGTVKFGADRLLDWLDGIERAMLKAISNAGKAGGGHLPRRQDGRGLAFDRRDDRAGAGRLPQHRLRPALRLPAQPHRGQGDGEQDPYPLPGGQHHPHRLRPQRHQGQPGKPHQADAGGGQGAAGRCCPPRGEPPHRRGAGRRRAPSECR